MVLSAWPWFVSNFDGSRHKISSMVCLSRGMRMDFQEPTMGPFGRLASSVFLQVSETRMSVKLVSQGVEMSSSSLGRCGLKHMLRCVHLLYGSNLWSSHALVFKKSPRRGC